MPADNQWSIVVAGGEGDVFTVTINRNAHINQLLREAVRELYGTNGRSPDEFDVIIGGAVANLADTLEDAGLTDGAEVTVLPKDVSRG